MFNPAPHAVAAHWFMLHHRVEAAEALAEKNRPSAIRHLDIADFYGRFIYQKEVSCETTK